ncbi:MAG: S41 family peptidase [Anaerolineales bacterium]
MSGNKVRNIIIGGLFGLVLSAGLFGAGVAFGQALPGLSLDNVSLTSPFPSIEEPQGTIPPGATAGPTQSRQELFAPFWEAWDIVHEDYVDSVNDVDLMRGAIRGMMEALGDPHSGYMDPSEYQQANIPLEGQYEGIGAWVDPDGEYLTIIAPMPGSPAEEAGLEPGDEIIAVDGEDVTGMDGNQVIRLVMGPAGSTVELTVRREGRSEPFVVEVERREITIPSVESEMLEGDIAYVQLFNFGEDTTRDLRQALRELQRQDPQGLILDLRGNGGGFLGTAINVADEFLPNGLIMTERFGDGSEQEYDASRGGLAVDIPLVVLINEGSASASEIVAGAIQDRERGTLVGTTSFGKGSVQNWIPLSEDEGAVRVTVARWYTPDGRQISENGLTPDVVVEVEPAELEDDEDPQLERAIEILLDQGN